jgi:arylsulfatase A-like enzyme
MSRRRFLGAAGLGVAGTGLGLAGWYGLGAGSSPEGRNVVLVIIDTLRADYIRCYGNADMRTPNIDALARDGVRFTSVFPEAMPTVPARRSIFTGRRAFPFHNWRPWSGMAKRPGWQPIFPGTETLFTTLRRAGYWTGYASDNPFLAYGDNFDAFRDTVHHVTPVRGQRAYRPHPIASTAQAVRWLPPRLRNADRIFRMRHYLAMNGYAKDESKHAVARVFRSGASLLKGAADQRRPFCLVVDSFVPHEPWAPPRKYLDLYGDPDYRGVEVGMVHYGESDYLTETHLRRLRVNYKACVTMTDRWLGRLLDRLHDLRLEDDTAVALISDHGIYLGDHGRTGKGEGELHPPLTHVPLVVRDPDRRGAGTVSDYFATTSDLAPTLVSLAGQRRPKAFEGADLSPIAEGGTPSQQRAYAYGGFGGHAFIRDHRWALSVVNDGRLPLLYDLEADPGERRNVVRENRDAHDRLWKALVARCGGKPPPRYSEAENNAEPRTLDTD